MKGTRPLGNNEIRSVSTCFAEVMSMTQFCLELSPLSASRTTSALNLGV